MLIKNYFDINPRDEHSDKKSSCHWTGHGAGKSSNHLKMNVVQTIVIFKEYTIFKSCSGGLKETWVNVPVGAEIAAVACAGRF